MLIHQLKDYDPITSSFREVSPVEKVSPLIESSENHDSDGYSGDDDESDKDSSVDDLPIKPMTRKELKKKEEEEQLKTHKMAYFGIQNNLMCKSFGEIYLYFIHIIS